MCRTTLSLQAAVVRCIRGHTYDVARHGYVSLLTGAGSASHADTPGMVAARERFLAGGHYDHFTSGITRAAATVGADGFVVDAGAGTGRHLAAVVDRVGADGIALDLSKHAARRAARAHPRVGAVVCDTWQALPVRDGVASLVLDVFAPRNPPEFHRVLRPGGHLIVVTARADHLRELTDPLGLLTVAPDKDQRTDDVLTSRFRLLDRVALTAHLELPHDAVNDLVQMGPNAWHTDPETVRRRIADMPGPVQVTAAASLSVYRAV